MPISLSAGEGSGTGQHMSTIMALYFFRVGHGHYSGASDLASEFETREAAWAEMTRVCSDLLGSIARKLKQNGEWYLELLDEAKEPLFRVRLVAETLG